MSTIFVKSSCFRRLLTYLAASRVLRVAAILKIWHRRSLAMAYIFAWLGDASNMYFMLCWRNWRGIAIRRLRWTTYVTKHVLTRGSFSKWLVFTAWQKIRRIEARERELKSKKSRLHQIHSLVPSACKYEDTDEDDSLVYIRAETCISIPTWRPAITADDATEEVSGLRKMSEMEISQLVDDFMGQSYSDDSCFAVPIDWRHYPSNQALKLL